MRSSLSDAGSTPENGTDWTICYVSHSTPINFRLVTVYVLWHQGRKHPFDLHTNISNEWQLAAKQFYVVCENLI